MSLPLDYLQALGTLVNSLIDENPIASSQQLDDLFRDRHDHLSNEKWNEQVDDNTLWLEHQIKRALAKRAESAATAAPAVPEFADLALPMIARGIPVIRIHRKSKRPIDSGWQNLATTDPKVIAEWQKDTPAAGCACVAKPDGFLFFECDDQAEYERFEKETGASFKTFTVQSSPGKFHYYLRQTDVSRKIGPISQASIPFGSLRQNNMYVVAPGSLHEKSGWPYTIVDDSPIIDAPEVLLNWLSAQRTSASSSTTADSEKTPAPIPTKPSSLEISIDPDLMITANRDVTYTSIAGSLRAHNCNFDEIYGTVLELISNHTVHEAGKPPHTAKDARRIATSVSRDDYAPSQEQPQATVMIAGKLIIPNEGTKLVGLRITKEAEVEEVRIAAPAPVDQTKPSGMKVSLDPEFALNENHEAVLTSIGKEMLAHGYSHCDVREMLLFLWVDRTTGSTLTQADVERLVDGVGASSTALVVDGTPVRITKDGTVVPAPPVAVLKEQVAPADEDDLDPRFEMTGDTFDPSVYDDLAKRTTPYPDPGASDLVSLLAKQLVHGTALPLAFVRETIKAVVLHAIDGKVAHPEFPELCLRGFYLLLGATTTGKTTSLEYAIEATRPIQTMSGTHVASLFTYKSEQSLTRSFTPEGSIVRDANGKVKSGSPGHASQLLHIKEGNQIASSGEYFDPVISALTNLYDQTEAGTDSISGGTLSAKVVKVSSVWCFTPEDFKRSFQGKGKGAGGIMGRLASCNPTTDSPYLTKDWEKLKPQEIQETVIQLTERISKLTSGNRQVLTEDPGAKEIRLATKELLAKRGLAGKRVIDYFMREQVLMAATSIDRPMVMTAEQAKFAQAWAEAQVDCRKNNWPADVENRIEAFEHSIRKAVCHHHVTLRELQQVCNYYRPDSGGWFSFSRAVKNVVDSGDIKQVGRSRKGAPIFCPGACEAHPEIEFSMKPPKDKK
jgi:hypothetical protein